MITETFNFFEVLGKDNKELIHSAFLKFLLEDSDLIWNKLFGIDRENVTDILLEKTFKVKNGDKNKLCRIDIEAKNGNGEVVLVVENKFKSFPYPSQLEFYNQHYKIKNKFLICFDAGLIDFEVEGWRFIGYEKLLNFIEKYYLNPEQEDDKSIFIKHYYKFLQTFFIKYEDVQDNSSAQFRLVREKNISKLERNSNNFWLNLIYSNLHIYLLNLFRKDELNASFKISPGNTSTPVLNILPDNWRFEDKGMECLLQFQGDFIKFYVHILKEERYDEEIVTEIKKTAAKLYKNSNSKFKFKGESIKKVQSFYIFKISVFDAISGKDNITVPLLGDYIFELLENINNNIIESKKRDVVVLD